MYSISMTHIYGFDYMARLPILECMKTTIDISDSLLRKAKQLANAQGITLRSLTEEGLKKAIAERSARKPYKARPVTVRGKGLSKEFQSATWERIRDASYESHGS